MDALAMFLFPVLTFLAIFISGISRDTVTLSILCAVAAVCLGLLKITGQKTGIQIPKNFWGMATFVAILQIYLIFVKDKVNPFNNALTFGIGILFWLIFYNLKRGERFLELLVLNLALLYSFFYTATKIFNIDLVRFSQLFFQEGLASRHYHMGDLWAYALVLIIGLNWDNFKLKTWVLIDIGFLFLVLSSARSAFVSLGIGILYIVTKTNKVDFNNKLPNSKKLIPVMLVALTIGLFVFSSINKSTLFSRPYFAQSIESFFKYPLGIGMGNFRQISLEYFNKSGDASKFSIYTHNIFLEALSGVGIFSILFLSFIYTTTKEVLNKQNGKPVWGALYLAILSNFMFDTTYTIPGLVWLLFMVLGVFEASKKSVDAS